MNLQKILRSTIIFLLGISVIGFSSISARAENSPTHSTNSSPGFHSVLFEESGAMKMAYSVLQGMASGGNQVCNSTSDDWCKSSDWFKFNSVLKPCMNSTDSDCIDSVGIQQTDGQISTGQFKNFTVENQVNEFKADSNLHIPAGGMPSIWSVPSAAHASGDLYAVVAQIVGSVNKAGNINERIVTTSLVPVKLTKSATPRNPNWDGNFYDNCRNNQQTPTRKNIQCSFPAGTDCILPVADAFTCYTAENFPANARMNLKLRLSVEPAGWLHGRLIDPNMTIEKKNNYTLLSITGQSTSVPSVYQEGMWDTFPDALKNFWVNCMNHGDQCGVVGSNAYDLNYWEKSTTLDGNRATNTEGELLNYGPIALEGMKAIAPLVGDKAIANPEHWNFRTLSVAEMSSANGCFTSGTGVKGIVTTNSTTYSEGPPEFSGGGLNYKVASAHYLPDGSVFKGTYNLVMRSDVARCLYKFSTAPIKASIEVVSESGDASSVATTIANEKDGWLYLSANNFTFSAPTVKVRLSQDVAARPSPVTPVTTKAPKPTSKQSAISCSKGKLTKKVTGIIPVCPKGYVKK